MADAAHPGGAPPGDRRRAPRSACFLPVRYESGSLDLDAFATDVSTRGLFVESTIHDAMGASGRVVFDHYLLEGVLAVECRVASVLEEGMGVAFGQAIPPGLEEVVRRQTSQLERRRVMMVDDEPELLRVFNEWIDKAGHKFVGVQSAFRSVEGILRFKPDVLVLDLSMPGMNGSDLCRLIRATPTLGRLKVLLYSAAAPAELEEAARDCLADGWVQKSARPSDVVARIEDLLAEAEEPELV